ncbi:tRNA 2-thiouridine(34) synthase MnmA [Thioalkalivibrio denitrificans]|uniref:tRNA-specific 2-thiouridylase MnmA n=1 Tax=Thioalkalivibrio denitrificans TaxID=108003 RepID=A0A1V3N863_9GAMM|nr:tRNA 2-thiouridine(34) synthase MnmA [Thioalkalivibrio denitrificans]OOG21205.1 tRNA 2-thiouridine(34) synthase MnmA [Thioalkalivibrio denitrificans]
MTDPHSERVIVGMSGGVDSSVAALRLLEQGVRVEGLFMKNWEDDDEPGYCAAAEDLADAQAVCDLLGITLHKVNFAHHYWDRVFRHFLDEYQAGRTPNPDILCNREIKFRAFLDYARELGAARIATGHYARIGRDGERFTLLTGLDAGKDQTYFLYTLGQAQLSRSLFPLGEMQKEHVREIAREHGLPVHDKKDSTGICFIGERRFRDFLKRYLPARPGEITDPEGHVLGEHQGLMYYTLGQRQGLGIGGVRDGHDAPWYVVDKDMGANRLIVAQGHDHPLLFHPVLRANDLHWVSGVPPTSGLQCQARIRHRQARQDCRLTLPGDGTAEVRFHTPQRAITPGQSVVFYLGDQCLGGGIITDRFNRSTAG